MAIRVFYKATDVGTFVIQPNAEGKWCLYIAENDGDREFLGMYPSPGAAADDVYTQHTGWDPWDRPDRPNAPTDLGEWEQRILR